MDRFLARPALRRAALSLLLALAACGGGSDNGAPDPAPPPSTVPPVAGDRIEAFDPAAAPAAKLTEGAARPAQAAAASGMVRTVVLGPLQAPPTKATVGSGSPGAPLQIGQARSVADTATPQGTAALLQWHPSGRNTQVAALRFVAEGAHGVRLGVLVEALPPGAVLRAYGAPQDEVVEVDAQALRTMAARHAEAGADDRAARTWWSPDFGGAQTTLEVEIPHSAATDGVRLSVPRLSHFTQTPDEAQLALQTKAAGSCNVDLACRPEYLEQGRSVARMVFVREDGKAYLCTGTLMNDAASSGTPYFLSANHCIDRQTVASTLTTEWFLRARSCGGTDTAGAQRLTGGATLLYAAARTDVALMRLNGAPPAGIVYAGSYFGSPLQPGTPLAVVHHPGGDMQKISLGTLLHYSSCSDGGLCRASNETEGTYLTLGWRTGVVEGGSSGSAAFLTLGERRYVVGQLMGGLSSCARPDAVDYYGRFDLAYRDAIRRWLNPGG
ncbi:trypsin-like serine peptidase [Melaminivora alkalimesophila]|uniref:Trypsin-like peptidase n=1 Tax=Melaminivora alkalimesophila TaxID=1165852 RepID=A0A317RAI5_9BURK|nr:trypsin-like peptidase domain-containing protein [Melaminivora alkalimesophila]PWW45652.1 trypsin-like peptidase [Melaminivora alkalimesophila]